MIDMDILDTTYQYIIKLFVLNTMLHHVGMLWIIEIHEQLQYDMDKQNSEWMTCGPWYNTYIYKNLHGKVFEEFIRNARTDRYNIMCSIGAHEKKIHWNMMMVVDNHHCFFHHHILIDFFRVHQ